MPHALLAAACLLAGSAVAQPQPSAPAFKPAPLVLSFTQGPRAQQILPGAATLGWSYTGRVVSPGGGRSLVPVPNSYLGPTIHAWRGQSVTVHMTNRMDEPGTTHWHGLDVPALMDGYPTATTAVGGTFTYRFPVLNRAGTYWYHPHTDQRTVEQVYAGLAGYFIVHDEEERALGLPSGDYDLPVCIQDATFDASNQRVYNANMMNGFFGTTMLVNGWPDYTHPAATRAYRLRLLNGSVSRIYKLAFSDGTPMVAIGTDGGLLDVPRTYPYIMLSPGERVEVWADFRGKAVGSQVTLRSLAFSTAGGQGAALDVMRFSIDRQEAETLTLPAHLSTIPRFRLEDAVNAGNPKTYPINLVINSGSMSFTLNGGMFEPGMVADNETARCGTLEVIRVTNTSGAVVIPHPIHFHGRQFQMLDRSVAAGGLAAWSTVRDGIIMDGWKDTFLIMPQETVRILVRHSDYPGQYVYHCHNLQHEDMDMMRNFQLDP